MEYGVKFSFGITQLRRQVPCALEDATNELTTVARACLRDLLDQLIMLDRVIENQTQKLTHHAKQIDAFVRLQKIPGVGWLVASMLFARLGDGSAFRRGRGASASIGLVPSHSGSGERIGWVKSVNMGVSIFVDWSYMVHEHQSFE